MCGGRWGSGGAEVEQGVLGMPGGRGLGKGFWKGERPGGGGLGMGLRWIVGTVTEWRWGWG